MCFQLHFIQGRDVVKSVKISNVNSACILENQTVKHSQTIPLLSLQAISLDSTAVVSQAESIPVVYSTSSQITPPLSPEKVGPTSTSTSTHDVLPSSYQSILPTSTICQAESIQITPPLSPKSVSPTSRSTVGQYETFSVIDPTNLSAISLEEISSPSASIVEQCENFSVLNNVYPQSTLLLSHQKIMPIPTSTVCNQYESMARLHFEPQTSASLTNRISLPIYSNSTSTIAFKPIYSCNSSIVSSKIHPTNLIVSSQLSQNLPNSQPEKPKEDNSGPNCRGCAHLRRKIRKVLKTSVQVNAYF